MTCKDCIHYEVCGGVYVNTDIFEEVEKDCKEFEDKSLYIKLPCKVGDTLFDISEFVYGEKMPEMYEDKVEYIELQKDRESGELIFCVDGLDWRYDDFGKTVFFTREEAEEALKEMEK